MSTSHCNQAAKHKLSQLQRLGKKKDIDGQQSVLCAQEKDQQIHLYQQEVAKIASESEAIKESMAMVLQLGLHEMYQTYLNRLIEAKAKSAQLLSQIAQMQADKRKWMDVAMRQKTVANALGEKFNALNRKMNAKREDKKAHSAFLLRKY